MKANTNKFILTAALSVAMVGCGGGGSDGGDGGGGGGNNPSYPQVEGSMVSVNMSGKNFQDLAVRNESRDASMCSASTAYFESENVMAYSSVSHTEAQLRNVASKVEFAMGQIIGKFGFESMQELKDRKRAVSYPDLNNVLSDLLILTDSSSNLITANQLSPFFSDNVPDGYSGWDDPLLAQDNLRNIRLVRQALVVEPNGSEVPLILDEMITNAEALSGEDLSFVRERLSDGLLHDKIQVCVLPDSMAQSASGHTIGYNIAEAADFEFYTHEGTHFIQRQYTENYPRWFAEGQAGVFAGQPVASSKANVDILSILTFDDESNYSQDFYPDYALAYKAMAANASIDEMMEFIQAYDLQPSWEINQGSGLKSDNYQFAELAFAKVFPNFAGGLTYDQLADQYANLAR